MTFNSGTATDYIDLLDQLIQVVTGRYMATIAINSGGTGHAVGDVLTITNTGATFTETAKIEVVTVAAGVITAARIYRGGVYTVDPTTLTGNAQSATTGSGISATFDLTFAAVGWTVLQRESEAVVAAPAIAAGGTGYTIGDVLTVVGGVLAPGGAAATYTVSGVTTGAVTAVTTTTQGDYEVFPTNPALTTVSPLGGTGCTLTLASQFTTGDTIVTLQGDAGVSADPLVGIKTYSSETDETGSFTVYNWALFGMTSWSSMQNLHLQSNISPGFSSANNGAITTSTSGDGAFVPLKPSDAFNIDWWISATGRRVTLIAKVEGASTTYYAQASFGLLNQFGITAELPYPAYVAAPSDRKRVWYRDTSTIWGGISEVISRNNGPMFVWSAEGAWLEAKNAALPGNLSTTPTYNTANVAPRVQVWPLGTQNPRTDTENIVWTSAPAAGFDNGQLTLTTNPTQIYRTPDSGGDLFPLFPVTVCQGDSSSGFYRTFGELDGAWWFQVADSGASSEDRFTRDGVMHTIFQNGTRIENFSFLALREE